VTAGETAKSSSRWRGRDPAQAGSTFVMLSWLLASSGGDTVEVENSFRAALTACLATRTSMSIWRDYSRRRMTRPARTHEAGAAAKNQFGVEIPVFPAVDTLNFELILSTAASSDIDAAGRAAHFLGDATAS
jgi:hypothetical protein